MEERPASRTVTAYARGLYLAQVFQLAVAGIAILAVVIGGYMVARQRADLKQLEAAQALAAEKLAAAEAMSGVRLEFNSRLIGLGTQIAGITPGDPAGYSAGLAAIGQLEADFATDLAAPEWREAALRLKRLTVNLLEASQQFDRAAAGQAALVEALGDTAATADLIRLATLHCRKGDFATAQFVVTGRLMGTDPAEFNDTAFQDACAARISLPVRPLGPGEDEAKEVASGPDAEDGAPAPGRGPASDRGDEPAAVQEVQKVFLHIREEGQRAAALKIAQKLCAAGYEMPGIEKVEPPRAYPSTPRVIYYHSDQAGEAGSIGGLITQLAGDSGLPGWAIPYDLRLYRGEGLPRDRVEIWFPETTELSAERVQQRFRCGPAPPG